MQEEGAAEEEDVDDEYDMEDDDYYQGENYGACALRCLPSACILAAYSLRWHAHNDGPLLTAECACR